jgi:hypothetical protein
MTSDFFPVGVSLGQIFNSFWRICRVYLILLDVCITLINMCVPHAPVIVRCTSGWYRTPWYCSLKCACYTSLYDRWIWLNDMVECCFIWEILGSYHNPETVCPNWGFSWFSSVPRSKCWDNTSNQVVILPYHCQFIIHWSLYHSALYSLSNWQCH